MKFSNFGQNFKKNFFFSKNFFHFWAVWKWRRAKIGHFGQNSKNFFAKLAIFRRFALFLAIFAILFFFFSKNSIFWPFENGEKQNLAILANIQKNFSSKLAIFAIFFKKKFNFWPFFQHFFWKKTEKSQFLQS